MTHNELIELQKKFIARELELAASSNDPSAVRLHYHLAALHQFRARALEQDAQILPLRNEPASPSRRARSRGNISFSLNRET